MAKKANPMEELKKMNAKDRESMLRSLLKEFSQIKMRVRMGQDKQNHKVSELKRQIARLQTLSNQPKQ